MALCHQAVTVCTGLARVLRQEKIGTFGLGLDTETGELLPRLRRGARVDPMVALRYE